MDAELYALFRAIAADPLSNVPRLVAADWLQEHGDAEWAHAIRHECEHHDPTADPYRNAWSFFRGPRRTIRERFRALEPAKGRLVHYDRGFPASIELDTPTYLSRHDELSTVWPLTNIRLNRAAGHEAQLASFPPLDEITHFASFGSDRDDPLAVRNALLDRLSQLVGLQLSADNFEEGHGKSLLDVPMPQLRELTVIGRASHMSNGRSNGTWLAKLFDSPSLRPIHRWQLTNIAFPRWNNSYRRFVLGGRLTDCRELTLEPTDNAEAVLQLLATTPDVLPLQKLSFLCYNRPLDGGLEPLFQSSSFSALKSLAIPLRTRRGADKAELIRGLATHQPFPNLESLELSLDQSRRHDWATVLPGMTAVAFPKLRRLSLPSWAIRLVSDSPKPETNMEHAAIFEQFIRSDLVGQLETLDLCGSRLGDVGMRFLASSPSVRNLRQLVLSGCELTDDQLTQLFRSEHLTNLRILDLGYNDRLTEAAFEPLLSPTSGAIRLESLAIPAHLVKSPLAAKIDAYLTRSP